MRKGFRRTAGRISEIRKLRADSPPYKGAESEHGRKSRANIRYGQRRRNAGEVIGTVSPLSVQALIPAGCENGKGFPIRILKAIGFP